MKTKNIYDYLQKRLHTDQLTAYKRYAQQEIVIFTTLQKNIAILTTTYMHEHNLNVDQLADHLHIRPSQLKRIQKGIANLKLSDLAHLLACMDKHIKDLF